MARHPNPSVINERSGAYDHDPQRRDARALEPRPSGPLGGPPAHLNDAQQAVWHELASQVPVGVLTVSDRLLLEIGCRLIARMRAGEAMKAAETNQIISILARMGMTPADRTRIAVTPQEAEERDPFAQLAKRPRIVQPTNEVQP